MVHGYSFVREPQRPVASSVNWACCLTRSPALGTMPSGPGLLSGFSRPPPSSVPYTVFSAFTLNSGCSMPEKNTRFFLVRKHEMTLKELVEGSRQKVKVYDGIS